MTCKQCGQIIKVPSSAYGVCLPCVCAVAINPLASIEEAMWGWTFTLLATPPRTRTDELMEEAIADVRANHAEMMRRQQIPQYSGSMTYVWSCDGVACFPSNPAK